MELVWFKFGFDSVSVWGLVLVLVPDRKEGAVFGLWLDFCLCWEVQSLILVDEELKTLV